MTIRPDDLRDALAHGPLQIEGRLVDASNATLRCTVEGSGIACVYKPVRGERPLWDFPDGTLAGREVAAYELAVLGGFDCIPLTVWRDDGPYGPGMCQQWIEVDDEAGVVDIVPATATPDGWRTVFDGEDNGGRSVRLVHEDSERLRAVAALDAVLNNADRKGGHLLVDASDRLWAIDHGVCFAADPKLRTVLWGFAGEAVSPETRERIDQLATRLSGEEGARVLTWLDEDESDALIRRIDSLRLEGCFPAPYGLRRPLPWPVF